MIEQNLFIDTFARAIAAKEGFYKQGGKVPPIPRRLSNPGDLRHWKDKNGRAYPVVNGFVKFPECERPGCKHVDHPCEAGWSALRAQCKINVFKRRLTFREFFAGKPRVYDGYAPSRDGNNPRQYANDVLAYLRSKLALPESVLYPEKGVVEPLTIETPIYALVAPLPMEKAA